MPKLNHNRDCGMFGDIQLFAGTASPDLARGIARYLDIPLSEHQVKHFPNDNLWVQLGCSARGQDTYVIQTTSRPTHRNLMELLITLQTLRLDSAGRVTAVVPYMCYARSDKKDKPRVPITARLVADMIEVAGADRYMTLDLHAGQIQGFFSIPGDVLSAFHILSEYILDQRDQLENPVVLTADLGFAKKGRNFAAAIEASMAFVEKRRMGSDNHPEALSIIGNVEGRDVIVVDDEVDTGKSVSQAVHLARAHGARKVFLLFVHPILSNGAAQILADLPLNGIVATDTIPISPEKRVLLGDKLVVKSVAPLLGEVIRRAHEGRSVGEMFNE